MTDRTDRQTEGQTDIRRRIDPLVSPLLTAGDKKIRIKVSQVKSTVTKVSAFIDIEILCYAEV